MCNVPKYYLRSLDQAVAAHLFNQLYTEDTEPLYENVPYQFNWITLRVSKQEDVTKISDSVVIQHLIFKDGISFACMNHSPVQNNKT